MRKQTYIMSRMFRTRVIQRDILHGIRRTDDLGRTVLPFGGPHGQPREEATVAELELAQGIGNIASVIGFSSLSRYISCIYIFSSMPVSS